MVPESYLMSGALGGVGMLIVPTSTREERTAALLERFRYADSWRKQYDARAVEWYKLYIGHVDRDIRAPEGERSHLHIPRTYEQVDTLRARFVKSFFSVRPYLEFLPRPEDGGQPGLVSLNEVKAEVAAALVNEQLDKNNIVRVFYDFVTSFLVFPAGIMSVGWRYEERPVRRRVPRVVDVQVSPDGMMMPIVQMVMEESMEPVWDDNELVNVDFFDFWPDPRGRDLDSARFVFHREWCTQEQLQERLEVLAMAGSGDVYPINWEELRAAGSGLEEGRWERLSAVGISPETSDGAWEGNQGRMFEVLHYWEDRRHAILVNRSQLVYDGANPYWRHGKKPFVVAVFDPLPNEFYGLSAVQVLEHMQHELNTLRNQRIDNVALVLNRMWKVRRGADIDESELVSRPHGIIHVDEQDDVLELAMSDVTASSYNDEQILKMDMEGALGVPAVVRGMDSPRRETATETVTKSSHAAIRFDVKIMLFETLGIKRLAYLMDMNNQQFIDAPRVVRLFGQDATEQWQWVQPGELIGEFDYRPSGANVDPAANKEIRREQLNQVMEVVLRTSNPYVDQYELTKMWLESYDIRNTEKLLITREQLMMQQLAMASQLGAPVQGGVPLPAGAPPGGAPPLPAPMF